jgi:hypothetical protein
LLLLISYDLTTRDRPPDYEALENAIKESAIESLHPLYSQWLVQTNEDVETWGKRLTPLMKSQDRLLIVRIQGPVNGWLPKAHWEWINTRAV